MQGWKTVGLRIRGAKSEIEQMGLETDGMLESTAKLRNLLKAGAGVDIMLDENTFKSTYDIIRELGAVWKDIKDVDQAAILEAIAGKRQSNVVAAALENYERLGEVLTLSEESAGSAAEEQERFARSIQYSINSFKAAYQELANDFIDSGFVKGIVDFGSKLIQGLDFIISKTGILKGLLTGFGSLALVKTLTTLSDKIQNIGKSLSAFTTIMSTLDKSGKGNTLLSLTQLATASKSLSDSQFDLVLSSKNLTDAQLKAMMQARGFTKEQINAQLATKAGAVATTQLTTATAGATTATFSLSGAFKGLWAVIAANPIGAIITGVTILTTVLSSLKRKREEQEQLEIEATQKAAERAKASQEEVKAYKDLQQQYINIVGTTSDLASRKSELANIQDQIIEKTGAEKDAIDLLNGSLAKNIELTDEQAYENAKAYTDDAKNRGQYDKAVSAMSHIGDLVYKDSGLGGYYENTGAASVKLKVGKSWGDTSQQLFAKYDNAKLLYGSDLYITGTLQEQYDTLKAISEEYVKQKGYHQSRVSLMTTELDRLKSQIDTNNQIITEYEAQLKIVKELSPDYFTDDQKKQWDDLLGKVETTKNELADLKENGGSYLDIVQSEEKLAGLRSSLEILASGNEYLQTEISNLFTAIDVGANSAGVSVATLAQNFDERLGGSFSESLKSIDKITQAMQTLANGQGLDWETFSELNFNLDSEHILDNFREVNNQYYLLNDNMESLIKLKDSYIKKQIESINAEKEASAQAIRTAQVNLTLAKNALTNVGSESDAKYYQNQIVEIETEISSINKIIDDDNTLIAHLNSLLGDTVDKAKVIEAIQERADEYAKAMENNIDAITDKLQAQQKSLQNQVDTLNEQLEVLEAQQKEIEEIISGYDKVASVVSNAIDTQIDALEEQKSAVEEYYNNQIEQLQKANDERQDAIDLIEKQNALENAKNQKVRYYTESSGWQYGVDQEALSEAQNALAETQNNQQIKALEDRRDAEISMYDTQIKDYQDYADSWSKVSNKIKESDDERLAEQILGSDWREKINDKNTDLLTSYANSYTSYKSQLDTLVNGEIAQLKNSIKAKEDEVKAVKKQIDSWNDYKDTVDEAVKNIQGISDEYKDVLSGIYLDEKSSYEDRLTALQRFTKSYTDYMASISSISEDSIEDSVENLKEAIELFNLRRLKSLTGYGLVNSAGDARIAKLSTGSYSSGGTNSTTGLAMLHGTRTSAETIFNASQSKQLYEMVRTGKFANFVADKAFEGIGNALRSAQTNNSNTNTIVINGMTIKSDNPAQFHDQFMSEIGKYWNVKLTENYVR